jgi:hypothetical protein
MESKDSKPNFKHLPTASSKILTELVFINVFPLHSAVESYKPCNINTAA